MNLKNNRILLLLDYNIKYYLTYFDNFSCSIRDKINMKFYIILHKNYIVLLFACAYRRGGDGIRRLAKSSRSAVYLPLGINRRPLRGQTLDNFTSAAFLANRGGPPKRTTIFKLQSAHKQTAQMRKVHCLLD